MEQINGDCPCLYCLYPESIRRGTHTGRPLGSDSFLSKLEHALGRRVRALPVGRQKGWRKKKPGRRAPRTG